MTVWNALSRKAGLFAGTSTLALLMATGPAMAQIVFDEPDSDTGCDPHAGATVTCSANDTTGLYASGITDLFNRTLTNVTVTIDPNVTVSANPDGIFGEITSTFGKAVLIEAGLPNAPSGREAVGNTTIDIGEGALVEGIVFSGPQFASINNAGTITGINGTFAAAGGGFNHTVGLDLAITNLETGVITNSISGEAANIRLVNLGTVQSEESSNLNSFNLTLLDNSGTVDLTAGPIGFNVPINLSPFVSFNVDPGTGSTIDFSILAGLANPDGSDIIFYNREGGVIEGHSRDVFAPRDIVFTSPRDPFTNEMIAVERTLINDGTINGTVSIENGTFTDETFDTENSTITFINNETAVLNGSIEGEDADPDFFVQGGIGSIRVENFGFIGGTSTGNADRRGILLGAGDDTVLNAGTVDGDVLLGFGDDTYVVDLDSEGTATVTGDLDGGDGQDRRGVSTAEVTSTIFSDSPDGVDGQILNFEELFAEARTPDAELTLNPDMGAAILDTDMSVSGPGTIINNVEFTRVGTTGSGVTIDGSVTFENNATITGEFTGIEFAETSDGARFVNNEGGFIDALGDGLSITGSNNADTVVNGGRLRGRVELNGGDDTFLIDLDADTPPEIEGAVDGGDGNDSFGVTTTGVRATTLPIADNFEELTAEALGAGAQLTLNPDGTLLDPLTAQGGGTIIGNVDIDTGDGAGLTIEGAGTRYINNANISGDVLGVDFATTSSSAEFINEADGVVTAAGGAPLTAIQGTLGGESVTNRGTVTGDIALLGGNDELTVSGLVTGEVFLDSGDDVFTFDLDGSGMADVTGQISGGGGNDSFIIRSEAADAIVLNNLSGFEEFTVEAVGPGAAITLNPGGVALDDTLLVTGGGTVVSNTEIAANDSGGAGVEIGGTGTTFINNTNLSGDLRGVQFLTGTLGGTFINETGGSVTAQTGATITAVQGADAADTFINRGTVTGDTVLLGGGDDVTNDGILLGGLFTGDGSDSVSLGSGSTSGVINLGGGDDNLLIDFGASFTGGVGSLDGGAGTNFANLIGFGVEQEEDLDADFLALFTNFQFTFDASPLEITLITVDAGTTLEQTDLVQEYQYDVEAGGRLNFNQNSSVENSFDKTRATIVGAPETVISLSGSATETGAANGFAFIDGELLRVDANGYAYEGESDFLRARRVANSRFESEDGQYDLNERGRLLVVEVDQLPISYFYSGVGDIISDAAGLIELEDTSDAPGDVTFSGTVTGLTYQGGTQVTYAGADGRLVALDLSYEQTDSTVTLNPNAGIADIGLGDGSTGITDFTISGGSTTRTGQSDTPLLRFGYDGTSRVTTILNIENHTIIDASTAPVIDLISSDGPTEISVNNSTVTNLSGGLASVRAGNSIILSADNDFRFEGNITPDVRYDVVSIIVESDFSLWSSLNDTWTVQGGTVWNVSGDNGSLDVDAGTILHDSAFSTFEFTGNGGDMAIADSQVEKSGDGFVFRNLGNDWTLSVSGSTISSASAGIISDDTEGASEASLIGNSFDVRSGLSAEATYSVNQFGSNTTHTEEDNIWEVIGGILYDLDGENNELQISNTEIFHTSSWSTVRSTGVNLVEWDGVTYVRVGEADAFDLDGSFTGQFSNSELTNLTPSLTYAFGTGHAFNASLNLELNLNDVLLDGFHGGLDVSRELFNANAGQEVDINIVFVWDNNGLSAPITIGSLFHVDNMDPFGVTGDLFANFQVENVDLILAGRGASIYGSDALAGVINFTVRDSDITQTAFEEDFVHARFGENADIDVRFEYTNSTYTGNGGALFDIENQAGTTSVELIDVSAIGLNRGGRVLSTPFGGSIDLDALESDLEVTGRIFELAGAGIAVDIARSNLRSFFDGPAIETENTGGDAADISILGEVGFELILTSTGIQPQTVGNPDNTAQVSQLISTGAGAAGLRTTGNAHDIRIANEVLVEATGENARGLDIQSIDTTVSVEGEVLVLATGVNARGIEVGRSQVAWVPEAGAAGHNTFEAAANWTISLDQTVNGIPGDPVSFEGDVPPEVIAAGADAVGLLAAGDNGSLTMGEGALIGAEGERAIGAALTGNNLNVSVAGEIRTEGTRGIGLLMTGANGMLFVDATGVIETQDDQSSALVLAGSGTIADNFGTIRSFGDAAPAVLLTGAAAESITFTNNAGGTVAAIGSPTLPMGITPNAIEGPVAIQGGDGIDLVANAGTVEGGIDLAGGDDVLTLQTGSSISGPVSGGEGNDSLIVDVTDTLALEAALTLEFESLAKNGAGVLDLSGDFGFNSVAVNAGILNIATGGMLTTPILTVANGGTLTGGGTVVGDAAIMGGVAPGDDGTGALTIDGDLTLGPDSSLFIEIDESGSDQLIVTGDADLGGSTLVLQPSDNSFGNFEIDFLMVDGTISGEFGDIEAPAFFDTEIVIGDDGMIQLVVSALQFSRLDGLSAQGAVVAAYADGLIEGGIEGPTADALLGLADLDFTQIPAVLDQLHPEAYASGPAAFVEEQAFALSFAFSSRSAQLARSDAKGSWGLWADGIGSTSDRGATPASGTSGFDTELFGIAAGGDVMLSDSAYLGAMVGYADGDQDFDAMAARNNFESTFFGAYGGVVSDDVSFSGFVAYSSGNADTSRTISAGATSGTANSAYDLDSWIAHGELGYAAYKGDGFTLTPRAALTYVDTDRKSTTESGVSGFNLQVEGASQSAVLLDLGATLSGAWESNGGTTFVPEASLAWRYDLKGDDGFATARFAGAGSGDFTVFGAESGRSAIRAGAGLTARLKGGVNLFIRYDGTFASRLDRHSGNIGVGIQF